MITLRFSYPVLILFLLVAGCSSSNNTPKVFTITKRVPVVSEQVPKGKWILVEANSKTLTVYDSSTPIRVFTGVAFGSRGVGYKQRLGDQVTPLGTYRIGWINQSSKFKLFFGLTYPNAEDADRASKLGLISKHEANLIRLATNKGISPPQQTRLGGMIGIHGVGAGIVDVHKALNWTDGCIALDNSQILELSSWIFKGMVVKIRP